MLKPLDASGRCIGSGVGFSIRFSLHRFQNIRSLCFYPLSGMITPEVNRPFGPRHGLFDKILLVSRTVHNYTEPCLNSIEREKDVLRYL